MRIRLFHDGEPIDVEIAGGGSERDVSFRDGDREERFAVTPVAPGPSSGALRIRGRSVRYLAHRSGSRVRVALLGETYEFDLTQSSGTRRAAHASASPETRSPMPGKVLQVSAIVGVAVKPGDPLVILEAMKMENVLVAELAGTVAEVHVRAGDMVEPGKVLVVVRPEA